MQGRGLKIYMDRQPLLDVAKMKFSNLIERLHHSGSRFEFTLSWELTAQNYDIKIDSGWASRNPESLTAKAH
jgi:hypothetical protein